MIQIENKKFFEEKERKLKKEVEKVKARHDTETLSFQLKMTASINEFKKSRSIEYDRLVQKFKNKFKEMELAHKSDLNSVAKLSK